jgi:transposase
MSPRFARAYVKSSKNDAKMLRPSARLWCDRRCDSLQPKSQAQQDMLALHRIRSLLIRERTALMNPMRGLLAECGVRSPHG